MDAERRSKSSRVVKRPSIYDDHVVEGVFDNIDYTTWEEDESDSDANEGKQYCPQATCLCNGRI
jgi:hypothetical protein